MKNTNINGKCIHAHINEDGILSTDVIENDGTYICTSCRKEFSYDEYVDIMLYFGHTEVIGIYGKLSIINSLVISCKDMYIDWLKHKHLL